jgi:hypothetical protein
MLGLILQKLQRRGIPEIGPCDAALTQIFAKGFDRPQELALLDRERAHGKTYGRALFKEQQRFQQRKGILAAGQRDGDTVAVTDHFESADRLTDFAEQKLFEVQISL